MKNDKFKETLLGPLNKNNPVVVQVLGICSALAVTVQLKPALVMGLSVTIIVALANVIISLLRNTIPNSVRIIVQLVVVAAVVTVVSEVLKAFAYDVSVQLSVYIGLIITNCILMGRLEAFAMSNKPLDSLLDGLGNGIGYAWILIVVAFFRELLGSGKLLGFQIIPESFYEAGYVDNGLMMMPSMALILVAWVHFCGQYDFRILLGNVFVFGGFQERQNISGVRHSGYIRIVDHLAGKLHTRNKSIEQRCIGMVGRRFCLPRFKLPEFYPVHCCYRRHCAVGRNGR